MVDAELLLPNTRTMPFAQIGTVHVSSTIAETIARHNTHELIFQTQSTNFVNSLIRYAQSQGTPQLRFRLGLILEGQATYLPWQQHIITDFNAAVTGSGALAAHLCRLGTTDSTFLMERATRVVSRSGLISDIVAEIGRTNGYSNLAIEPTVGQGLWIQSFIDDYDFVRNRLMPRAINAQGEGNYHFYDQDGTLHFHSPSYLATVKPLDYYGVAAESLTQVDTSQQLIEIGASGVRAVIYDPLTGQTAELASDPTKVLRLGNTTTQLTSLSGTELSLPYHLSYNTQQEAQNLAQSGYENAHAQTLELRLNLPRSIYLRAGDMLNINITPSADNTSVWSGTYLVISGTYAVRGGALTSAFTLRRGEYQTSSLQPTSAQLLSDNAVDNSDNAPGQPLNLKSTQSSPLTHGAGQISSTSVFAATQDANTAPNPAPAY